MNYQSLSISKSKLIRSLHLAKNRQKYNKYIAEGDKICKELLISNSVDVQYIVGTEKWYTQNEDYCKNGQYECIVTEIDDLKKVSQLSTASEVLVVAEKKELNIGSIPDFSLYLDGIQNPGNMGAILRIADWYGIQLVYTSKDCVDVYNAKVIQASMGSFIRVGTETIDLESLKRSNQFTVWGASLNGELQFTKAIGRNLLVIGNEGRGIRNHNLVHIDKEIKISAAATLGAESLNAAVATGILCDRFLK